MMKLDVPVPPILEEAIGYTGDAQWVAFYWTPAGDEAMYDDGRISGDGYWDAYLTFTRHSRVAPHLAGYNLGSSDFEADDYLLLNRATRMLYVAPRDEARTVLRTQWPTTAGCAVPVLTAEEWEQMREQIWAALRRPPDMAEIQARMQVHQAQLDALQQWLDQQNGNGRGSV